MKLKRKNWGWPADEILPKPTQAPHSPQLNVAREAVNLAKALHEDLKSLGESKTEYPRTYTPGVLERFPNPQKDFHYVIEIEAPEFSCLCPKTGQPDFAKILVTYLPDEWCIESKSFKLYLGSFRMDGAFHEDVTNRVAHDLFKLLLPHSLKVTGEFFPRGGISFHPTVTITREEWDEVYDDIRDQI